LSVSSNVFVLIQIVVHGPLVIIGADLAGVLLIVVLVGVDVVVGSAGSTVEVLALSLLGPCVVVISTLGSRLCSRCGVVSLSDSSSGVLSVMAVATVATVATVAGVLTVGEAYAASITVGSTSGMR